MIFAPNALHCNGRPTPGIWHRVNQQDWSKGECLGKRDKSNKSKNTIRDGGTYRVFFNWYPPKKLEYGKPRLDESTLT